MATVVDSVCIYPTSLLEPSASIATEERKRHWWLLYTKSRQEKAIGRDLAGYGVPFYLPMVTTTKLYGSRRVRARVPLFPGYVFLWGDEEERVLSMTTNRLSRILPVHDPDDLVRDLRQIHGLISTGAPLTHESRLAAGHRVRVRRGPFRALEGTVLSRRGETRLVVSVDFLQQGASVEIDDFLLERID